MPLQAWKLPARKTRATSTLGAADPGMFSWGRNAANSHSSLLATAMAKLSARRCPSVSAAQAPSGLATCARNGTLPTSAMCVGEAPSDSR